MVDYLLKLFNDEIWLTNERNLRLISNVLIDKLNSGKLEFDQQLLDMATKSTSEIPEPQIDGNIAYLPIVGQLVPKCSYLDSICGFTSTFKAHEKFLEFNENPRVETILLHLDSPGGAVTGVFEFAQAVKDSEKRVISFSDTQMTSGAYLIAAGSEIYTTPSANIGSIGVFSSVIKERINDRYETYIFKAGDEKAMGHPNIEMTQQERNYFQDRVNSIYEMFVGTIAEFRNLNEDEVLASKGSSNQAIFMQNFVDKIMTKEDFLKGVTNGSI